MPETSRFRLPSVGQYVAASGASAASFRKMETVHENVTEIMLIQKYLVFNELPFSWPGNLKMVKSKLSNDVAPVPSMLAGSAGAVTISLKSSAAQKSSRMVRVGGTLRVSPGSIPQFLKLKLKMIDETFTIYDRTLTQKVY